MNQSVIFSLEQHYKQVKRQQNINIKIVWYMNCCSRLQENGKSIIFGNMRVRLEC